MEENPDVLLEEFIGFGCREYNNDRKDSCRYCDGEERGWLEKEGWRQEFDHRLIHDESCVYVRAMAYLGMSDAEAYHD